MLYNTSPPPSVYLGTTHILRNSGWGGGSPQSITVSQGGVGAANLIITGQKTPLLHRCGSVLDASVSMQLMSQDAD